MKPEKVGMKKLEEISKSPKSGEKVTPIREDIIVPALNKTSWWEKIKGFFKKKPRNKDSKNSYKKNEKTEEEDSFCSSIQEKIPVYRPRPENIIQESLEKVEVPIHSFFLFWWETRYNRNEKEIPLRGDPRFHLPYVVNDKIINVFCNSNDIRYVPYPSEIESKKENLAPVTSRYNFSGSLEEARLKIDQVLTEKRRMSEFYFLGGSFPAVLLKEILTKEEKDRKDNIVDEYLEICRSSNFDDERVKEINERLGERADLVDDFEKMVPLYICERNIKSLTGSFQEGGQIAKIFQGLKSLIEKSKSFTYIFNNSDQFIEDVSRLVQSIDSQLRLLKCGYSREENLNMAELIPFFTDSIKTLRDFRVILEKWYLIKNSTYREYPNGFISLDFCPRLFKNEIGEYFCCLGGDPNQRLGKCCISHSDLSHDFYDLLFQKALEEADGDVIYF